MSIEIEQKIIQLILDDLAIKMAEPSLTQLSQDETILKPITFFINKIKANIKNQMPVATINIANAKAGASFDAVVDISLTNHQPAVIEAISFNEDIGLQFNKETQSICGIPTTSGDITLTITWTSGDISQTSTLTLIVNPDPRTLWKIIEPPENAPYFKKNVDHKLITTTEINIAGASRRGRSHEHVGSFRDDDFYVAHNAETGWSVLLVADGAGSAKNSREGSRIVSETVGEYLKEKLNLNQDLVKKITDWSEDEQKEIFTYFIETFHHAAKLAINALETEALKTEQPLKSYSTTLLVTVSLKIESQLFAASFWLGDGAIAAYGPTGKVRLLGTPDSGEYAGQTRFLDRESITTPDFSKRVIIGKWAEITHLMLMTDGVSDPFFETDNGLHDPNKWDSLVTEIMPILITSDTADTTDASERLAQWLNFFSPGDHDDRTLVVSW